MTRRILAGIVLAIVLTTGVVTLGASPAAAVPTPSGFCKMAIADNPTPPPPWVIIEARYVELATTHVTTYCLLSWQGTPGRYVVCKVWATLWWNGLWSFYRLPCDLYVISS